MLVLHNYASSFTLLQTLKCFMTYKVSVALILEFQKDLNSLKYTALDHLVNSKRYRMLLTEQLF